MKRVTSLGGVFFKSKNPEMTKKWYERHLGLETDEYGTSFEWRNAEDISKKGFTAWGLFKQDTKYFDPSKKEFMINYRVENLEWLVDTLRDEGVVIVNEIEKYEYGKFVRILDPENNIIELWEPDDEEYGKMIKVRTK